MFEKEIDIHRYSLKSKPKPTVCAWKYERNLEKGIRRNVCLPSSTKS